MTRNHSFVMAGTLFLMVLLVFGASASDAQETSRKATVKFVIGDVKYKRGSSDTWRDVRVGSKLLDKDLVRTQVESRIELLLDDGTQLSFEENSIVGLDKLLAEGGNTNTQVNIKTGKVTFNVKKLTSKKSDFVFETPTATAAIRGTQGGIGTQGKKTFAYLDEGKLELAPKGGGQGVTIGEKQVALQSSKGFDVKKVADSDALKKIVATVEKVLQDTSASGLEETEFNLDNLDAADSILVPTDTVGTDTTAAPEADTPDSLASGTQTDSLSAPPAPEEIVEAPPETELIETDTSAALEGTEVLQTTTPSDAEMFLRLSSPSDGMEVTSQTISITGTTLPGSKVTARALQATADASGGFTMAMKAPTDPGTYTIEVVAEREGKSARQSVTFVVPDKELVLSVEAPSEGDEITAPNITVKGRATAGAEIQVFEVKTRADVSGNWSATIQAPKDAGQYRLAVKAMLGGKTLSQDVGIQRVLPKVPVKGSVNGIPSTLNKAEVVLSGTCNDGATIQVAGFTTVARGGAWNLRVTWPSNQEGGITFPVYCVFNDEDVLIGEVSTEYEKPIVPLTMNLSTPTNLVQRSADLDLRGSLTGENVRVEVNGSGALVVNNSFTHRMRFTEQNWNLTEIVVRAFDDNADLTRTISLEVDRKSRSINTRAPRWVGEPLISSDHIRVSVADDNGDEGTVTFFVDGSQEEEREYAGTLVGQRFPLRAGEHDYKVEAVDQAGNKVIWERLKHGYYPRAEWTINVIEPRANTLKRIPPGPGGLTWDPMTDLRFRINSLPNDDYRYLRQITVRNDRNGYVKVLRDLQIDDVEFGFEIPLERSAVNTLRITVEPKIGPVREEVRMFTLQ